LFDIPHNANNPPWLFFVDVKPGIAQKKLLTLPRLIEAKLSRASSSVWTQSRIVIVRTSCGHDDRCQQDSLSCLVFDTSRFTIR
jgi:hypothetical protein